MVPLPEHDLVHKTPRQDATLERTVARVPLSGFLILKRLVEVPKIASLEDREVLLDAAVARTIGAKCRRSSGPVANCRADGIPGNLRGNVSVTEVSNQD